MMVVGVYIPCCVLQNKKEEKRGELRGERQEEVEEKGKI